MTKERASYPNIIYTPQDVADSRSKYKKGRFTNALVRAMAKQEAKKNNKPRFRCPSCNELFALSYGKFVRDTSIMFSEATYVCRQCCKQNESRYQPA